MSNKPKIGNEIPSAGIPEQDSLDAVYAASLVTSTRKLLAENAYNSLDNEVYNNVTQETDYVSALQTEPRTDDREVMGLAVSDLREVLSEGSEIDGVLVHEFTLAELHSERVAELEADLDRTSEALKFAREYIAELENKLILPSVNPQVPDVTQASKDVVRKHEVTMLKLRISELEDALTALVTAEAVSNVADLDESFSPDDECYHSDFSENGVCGDCGKQLDR